MMPIVWPAMARRNGEGTTAQRHAALAPPESITRPMTPSRIAQDERRVVRAAALDGPLLLR